MSVYYNEWDAYAAQWLRNLIDAGHLPAGDVDERSICDVSADDLAGYTSCHFFAGIGGWPLALRMAGWPDERPVWTGSCPCQPFSSAGKRQGMDDERHLWPDLFRLVQICAPPVVIGEQVAGADGLAWLDLVSADLEDADYTVRAADLCAAGVGAPHIRQRLFWMGYADGKRSQGHGPRAKPGSGGYRSEAGEPCGLGDSNCESARRDSGSVPDSKAQSCGERVQSRDQRHGSWDAGIADHWSNPDWVLCNDPGGARWRPVEPGTFPLAARLPGDVGRLRAYGNAIVPQVAAAFIASFMDEVHA